MAYGIELILGFPHDKWDKTPFKDFQKCTESKLNNNTIYDMVFKHKRDELIETHRAACKEAGFKFVSTDEKVSGYEYDTYETELGRRTMFPFRLELHFDSYEMDETVNEAVIGVSVSGRYFPTFIDWKDEHGAMYNIVFDDKLKKIMEISKKHIVSVLPWMKDAVWIVKQKYY